MSDFIPPDGSNDAEQGAESVTVTSVMYAPADSVSTYNNPKRYYGKWSADFSIACSGDGWGSSINDNGHRLTTHNCPSGRKVIKITPPSAP